MSMLKLGRYVPDLSIDMAECDTNYMRLNRLFPQMNQQDSYTFGIDIASKSALPTTHISAASKQDENNTVVTLQINQRCRYTTMLTIKVTSQKPQAWIKWPSLAVRAYHDIKSAEVVSFGKHHHGKFCHSALKQLKRQYGQHIPQRSMYQPDEKSQINKYFGELLTFCYYQGHSLERLI